MSHGISSRLERFVLTRWYRVGHHGPVTRWINRRLQSLINARATRLRKQATHPGKPVIIIGNITVGGTGKTPVVLAVLDHLRSQGWRPGVVSRGHGGRQTEPALLPAEPDPARFGDEACLIAERSACPVAVGRDRCAAAQLLVQSGVDVIISDDGLQHYRLARNLEIVLISASRGLGNGLCLPLGPLREPPERLDSVDLVLVNGGDSQAYPAFTLAPAPLVRLDGVADSPPECAPVHAVTGIGEPARFFSTLSEIGFEPIQHAWPDHYAFDGSEVRFDDEFAVVVTEKDAVKLRRVVDATLAQRIWVLPVQAQLPKALLGLLEKRLER